MKRKNNQIREGNNRNTRRLGSLLRKSYLLIALFFFVCILSAGAQTIFTEIKGRVIDEGNKPIPSAIVSVKQSANTAQTNTDGIFVLKNVRSTDSIRIAYVGYITQTIAARENLNIILRESTGSLNDVLVVGYGTQRKGSITGAVSSIKMDKINDIPVSNLSNALAGRAPGITVTNSSGLAGASSSIRVRGSFGEPLYVINGILKTKAAFDALDPNEIDQMTILKDAASASVYGSQAGNGVIVITTKTGTAQKPEFSFQVSNTIASTTLTPLADLTTSIDELIYQNRVAQFQYEQQANKTNPFIAPNGEAEFNYFKDKSYNTNDWIWRNPKSQKYLLSVNGGSDKVTYYNLLSYTKEQGSYKRLDFDKFNLRSDVTANISKAISLNLNVAAAQQTNERFYWPFDSADDYNVGDFYRVTFNWTKLYPFYLEKDGTPANRITEYPVQTPMGSWQAWNVIDQVVGDRYIQTKRRQFNPILSVNIKLDQFVKGLSAKFVGNYEATDFLRKFYLTYQQNYVFIPADATKNRFVPAPPDPAKMNTFTFSASQPNLQYQMENGWRYQVDGFLNYDRSFGKHKVTALAVYEQAQEKNYGNMAIGYAPITNTDQMFAYSNSAGNRYGTAYETLGANASVIGKAGYNYDDRYIADFSFRYDGNPNFAPSVRWGFFPSVSLAWRISQEAFSKKYLNWIDDLKLRASYGTTGNPVDVNNNQIAPFTYEQTFYNSGAYIFGNTLQQGIAPGVVPNPNITWATVHNANIGLDFAFLKSRLSGSVDVFKNKMKNILGSRQIIVPASFGSAIAPENYAARTFYGADISLQWQDRAGEFSYSFYGNLGYAKDRWDILDQSADYLPGGVNEWRSIIGQPANRLIGLKATGMVRTQDQLNDLKAKGFTQFGRSPYLGAIIYEDIRGDSFKPGADGKVDANDQQLLSNNGKPRINFGLGFKVTWKGIAVDALFQGVGAYDRMISNLEGGGIRQWGGNFRTYYPIWASDVWTPENPNAKYPRVVGENWQESGTGASSFWMRNGAYLRLRNINVAYNLPQKWISKIGLSGTQLFFNGTNLLTFSAMKEFHDPEQEYYDSYPIMKTFTLGLNVKF